jgi:hypothetical protein
MAKAWVICSLCSKTIRRGDGDGDKTQAGLCASCRVGVPAEGRPAKVNSAGLPRLSCVCCRRTMATPFVRADGSGPFCIRCYRMLERKC